LLHVLGVGEGKNLHGFVGKPEDVGVNGWNTLQGDYQESDGRACIGFTCLRIEISGGNVWAWY